MTEAMESRGESSNKMRTTRKKMNEKAPSNMGAIFLRVYHMKIRHVIRETCVKPFWSHFTDSPTDTQFLEAGLALETNHSLVREKLRRHTPPDSDINIQGILKAEILSQKPHFLEQSLIKAHQRSFLVYIRQQLAAAVSHQSSVKMEVDGRDSSEIVSEDDYDEKDLIEEGYAASKDPKLCFGCVNVSSECDCQNIAQRFKQVHDLLRRLYLMEGLLGDTLMETARVFIERKVNAKGKANYSCSFTDELKSWVRRVVFMWVISIYGYTQPADLKRVADRLDSFLNDAYARMRVAHMFEIILEYPMSEAAIQDLKKCLDDSTDSSCFRLYVIDSVRQSLIDSLLHPGVNTYDILTAYISAIKALRALDPNGLILQLVTEPVRRYLKSRDDTVRCIVTALLDEDHNSELNREMIKGGTESNENGSYDRRGPSEVNAPYDNELCSAHNFANWKPDPIKIRASDDSMKSNRFSDIVSILVNIYETKDLFVEEYQRLLSQRLLNKYDECNLDTELRNLELLMLRFSDCELHRCEVMLKDVQTSKRINKRILSGDIRDHKLEGFRDINVLIVSSPFWPEKFSPMATVSEEPPNLSFPPELEQAINTYNKAFESIQASRTLHWRAHLGTVKMDVTINGRTQNFSVSPLHAAILYLFQKKKVWKLSELTHKTSLPAATLRSRLALWQRNGLIVDSGEDKYELVVDGKATS